MTKEDFCCEAVKEAVTGGQGGVRKRVRESSKEQEKRAMAQEWSQIDKKCVILFIVETLLVLFTLH